ncbi:hypothetical protein TIFTF001_017957 [Ficus carica]|uniref:Uncharacterized protein n=1 Tax=Ficus carica TaxID=3494 RepID=A0AA88DB85_FICCA|nr:hypothetical protein TIFTF001_017957 [Ficus carica]
MDNRIGSTSRASPKTKLLAEAYSSYMHVLVHDWFQKLLGLCVNVGLTHHGGVGVCRVGSVKWAWDWVKLIPKASLRGGGARSTYKQHNSLDVGEAPKGSGTRTWGGCGTGVVN